MDIRRTAILLALVAAALTAPAAHATSTAGPETELVCASPIQSPAWEVTLRLPSRAVDRLVEHTPAYRGPCAEYGERADLGNGEVTAYSQVVGDRPVSVGMIMTDDALDGLPHDPPTDGKWCFDKNDDGTVDPMKECSGGYESQLDLGPRFRSEVDSPFTYVLNNWNPHGHIPLGVYDLPHFDVHFYVNDDAERTAIRPGPCPQLVNCDDYELGKRLPEGRYLAPDYADLDAVEPAMGNHLVDPTAPEFNGERFDHTWIYGVWNREVTFYEAMVTHETLDGIRGGGDEDGCHAFKLPDAWQESGWYPTSYCLRNRDNRDEITVSLEDFVYREAS
ncbi:hypothetical protein [Solicola gregarius]|uniref:DUF5602 domain-containing protein n=1 Tax=Solicola gregarius TaxID=2908642 RepID=A0AA46YM71_9ACTN|nr:hypothetical protein [Solicola gregarius]UYM06236.1 hypothetical protein L0C25_03925 [Solicola gregarius]